MEIRDLFIMLYGGCLGAAIMGLLMEQFRKEKWLKFAQISWDLLCLEPLLSLDMIGLEEFNNESQNSKEDFKEIRSLLLSRWSTTGTTL